MDCSWGCRLCCGKKYKVVRVESPVEPADESEGVDRCGEVLGKLEAVVEIGSAEAGELLLEKVAQGDGLF